MKFTSTLLIGVAYAGDCKSPNVCPGGWTGPKPGGYELLYEGIGAHPWFQLPRGKNFPTISLDDCFEMVREDPTCLAFGYFQWW